MIRMIYMLDNSKAYVEERPSVDRIKEIRATATILWIDLDKPTNEEIDLVLRNEFCFHELCIEDCLNESHHPKIDIFDDYLFLITNGIPDLEEGEFFKERRINAFIGESFLVTIHLYESVAVKEVISLCLGFAKHAAKGVDHIYHLILDITTDQYIAALELINEEMAVMEEQVFSNADQKLLNEIIREKRQILVLHRSIRHQKDILFSLSTDTFTLITKKERRYYHNVYDHLMRASDTIEFYREQANGLLSVYLSVTSNKMNEVMKVLTIIATIMLPLTLIAGIYGMNFKHMPELGFLYGYPMALGLMAAVTLIFLWYFRKKRWL
jgi:magnesium transporter